MENAVDAIKIASAILIFIIAFACSFSLFGTAKQTADSIITMRDKQAYLETAEEDVDGILYTSSSSIIGQDESADITTEYVSGVTKNGDRIVNIDDVISTIYRYSKEKYGVTIVKSTGEILARFDSVTETQYMTIWDLIPTNEIEKKDSIASEIKKNLFNDYVEVKLTSTDLENLYELKGKGTNKRSHGEIWYGSQQSIIDRINVDINGGKIEKNGLIYTGKDLLNEYNLKEKKIIEVVNEIDRSIYLKETNEDGEIIESNLQQQYNMPTVEIIYIVY